MAFARKRKYKQRAKPLDLARRSKLLGVTPGHLSRVLNGQRHSLILITRHAELLASETLTEQIKNPSFHEKSN